MEGRALKAALVKTPEEFKSVMRPQYDSICSSLISVHTITRSTWIIATLSAFDADPTWPLKQPGWAWKHFSFCFFLLYLQTTGVCDVTVSSRGSDVPDYT